MILRLHQRLQDYTDNHSLKALIKFINIDVSKHYQSSDFGGELAQLKYCANDVIYLHKIHEELTRILKEKEDFNYIKTV